MEKMRNFFKDESGATMVEYGLMVALIAVVAAVVRHHPRRQPQHSRSRNAATQVGS